jgi:hypothetical protein
MKELNIRLEVKGDYVHYVCDDCKESVAVEFTEMDPSVPKVKFTCSKHGWMGPIKVYRTDFGPKFTLNRAVSA